MADVAAAARTMNLGALHAEAGVALHSQRALVDRFVEAGPAAPGVELGAALEQFGAAGTAENQVLELKMRITNPSATAQVMVAAARASTRMAPGCYTLAEVPPVALVAGDIENLLKQLV